MPKLVRCIMLSICEKKFINGNFPWSMLINKTHSLPSQFRTYACETYILPCNLQPSKCNENQTKHPLILHQRTPRASMDHLKYSIKNAPISNRICMCAYFPPSVVKLLKRIDQELSKSVIQCIISRYLWKKIRQKKKTKSKSMK